MSSGPELCSQIGNNITQQLQRNNNYNSNDNGIISFICSKGSM